MLGDFSRQAMGREFADHAFFYIYSLYLTPFFFSALGFALGLLCDHLSERSEALQRSLRSMRELANRDDLTGLYNHRHLFGELSREIERSRRYGQALCGMMIDLDNFKEINDRYGHLAGDVVLKECGRILKSRLRQVDVLGRYGGDEFLAILPATDSASAAGVAERLRLAISDHLFKVYKQPVRVSVSVGLWTLDKPDHLTPEHFIDRADRALFEAKHAGRNRVCEYLEEMQEKEVFKPTKPGESETDD